MLVDSNMESKAKQESKPLVEIHDDTINWLVISYSWLNIGIIIFV